MTGGALGIVWGLVRGNQRRLGQRRGDRLAAAGIALLAGFVALGAARARADAAAATSSASRAFSAGNAAIFFTFASLSRAVFFYAQLLQIGAGLRAARRRACGCCRGRRRFITVAPIAGALADRIGERPLMVAGLVLQAAGMAWLALIASRAVAYAHLRRAVHHRRRRRLDGDPGRHRTRSCRLGRREALGKAAGREQHDAPARWGVRRSRVAVAVFAAAGSYVSASSFFDGFGPAIGVMAALSAIGALAASALPAPPAS